MASLQELQEHAMDARFKASRLEREIDRLEERLARVEGEITEAERAAQETEPKASKLRAEVEQALHFHKAQIEAKLRADGGKKPRGRLEQELAAFNRLLAGHSLPPIEVPRTGRRSRSRGKDFGWSLW